MKHEPTHEILVLRPNKKISVFQVKGLKVLDRVLSRHTYFFLIVFFSGKEFDSMHFERHFAFQNA